MRSLEESLETAYDSPSEVNGIIRTPLDQPSTDLCDYSTHARNHQWTLRGTSVVSVLQGHVAIGAIQLRA